MLKFQTNLSITLKNKMMYRLNILNGSDNSIFHSKYFKKIIRHSLLLILILFNVCNMNAQITPSLDELKAKITQKFSSTSGTFGLAYYNLLTGDSILINGDTVFHAASTMKTPVMIETFRQVSEGRIIPDDSITVVNRFKSIVDSSSYSLNAADDSDDSLYQFIGQKLTIYDLMYRMIIHSSNLATNIIIDLVGAQNVMRTMKKLGTKNMLVLRGVEDQKAYDAGLNNVTTAHDLMILFRLIGEGRMVSKDASDQMIKILEDQRHNEVIPALLPADVRVAHKTGNITGVEHDSGIVFLPDGRKYVLVILSKKLADRDSAVKMMAEVSRLIYDFVSGTEN